VNVVFLRQYTLNKTLAVLAVISYRASSSMLNVFVRISSSVWVGQIQPLRVHVVASLAQNRTCRCSCRDLVPFRPEVLETWELTVLKIW
jgi:hypothetical protein